MLYFVECCISSSVVLRRVLSVSNVVFQVLLCLSVCLSVCYVE